MSDTSNELGNITRELKSISSKLNSPLDEMYKQKRHKELTNLTKWLLIATGLMALSISIGILEKTTLHQDLIELGQLAIIILFVVMVWKLLALLLEKK